MSERLKQIWSGFEQKTSRRLTGRGIENLVTPAREEQHTPDRGAAPPELHAPAEAAFAALKAKLAASEKPGRSRTRRTRAALSNDGDQDAFATAAFSPDEPALQLLRGLKATSMRTERVSADYTAFRFADRGPARAEITPKKRKFLGIF